jgi:GNAT superfamily N-acetyltransferase
MKIEYFAETVDDEDIRTLYRALGWYGLSGYTDDDIKKAEANSFYSVFAYDGDLLVGMGRIASDGLTAAIMSGVCVRPEYRRRKIGEGIVARLIHYCQSDKYRIPVKLFCEDSLIPWYEKLGFERDAYGMKKPPPYIDDPRGLLKGFGEIYGIEQILSIYPDFSWYNFDSFGDFKYYSILNGRGMIVPTVSITFYIENLVADIVFENVSEFHIGADGLRTQLQALDIVNTEILGYDPTRRYKIRSLEEDNIGFYCENFRIIDVTRIHTTEDKKSHIYGVH